MIPLSKYFAETWSATPIQPPVGVVPGDGYQKIIDRNFKSDGSNQILLIKSPIKRSRKRKSNDD